ncbi:MAG: holo-ACP synthase [Candidatus Azotimanducaceae bacterium WSBS_2022_MAG_OTU7]
MIISIGTDIVEISRIQRSLTRFGERFTDKILCASELRPLTGSSLAAYLARQFSAKEAVSKALGTGMRNGVHFRNIEIARKESGAPLVRLTGEAKLRAEKLGISDIHISMSDERDYAIAYVIATKSV